MSDAGGVVVVVTGGGVVVVVVGGGGVVVVVGGGDVVVVVVGAGGWVVGVNAVVVGMVGAADAPTPLPMPSNTTSMRANRRTAPPNKTVRSLTRRRCSASSLTISPLRPR